MTNEWEEKYQQARQAYRSAVSTESLSISFEERKAAAKFFGELILEFDDGGPAALEILERYTKSDYPYMAFRILVEMTNPVALDLVVSAISESRRARVGRSTIQILGKQNSLPDDLWQYLAKVVEHDQYGNRGSILEALINRQTTYSVNLVKRLLATQAIQPISDILIKTLAKWGEFDQIRQIMQMPPEQIEYDYYGDDIRIDAAFYLALYDKDEQAVAALVSIANGADLRKGTKAVGKLAYLARPEAIEPAIRLLKSDDSIAAGFALNSTYNLGVPILGDGLLYLASRSPTFSNDLVPVPLADEAVRTFAGITGQSFWGEGKYVEDSEYEMEWTQGSRDKAIAYYREEIKSFAPSKRYYQGKLLTLPLLADNLIGWHIGPIWKSAYNLPAITGLDFGFDPDLDLISNLDAVIAWREYAATSTVLEPGGWAFNGKPLPDPVL